MPRELIAIAPRKCEIREFKLKPLGKGQIRVRSEFGAFKHGTELRMYRGTSLFTSKYWDSEWHLFLPRSNFTMELDFHLDLAT